MLATAALTATLAVATGAGEASAAAAAPSGRHRLMAEVWRPRPAQPASDVATPTLANDFTRWAVNDDKQSPTGWYAYNWNGVAGNAFSPDNVTVSGGRLALRTVADGSKNGGEVSSVDDLGYGYYETTMKAADVSGVCSAFFWYMDRKAEVDVEFLTNGSWIDSASSGVAHLTWHGPDGAQGYAVRLGFNPAKGYHRYGFLIRSTSIRWYADGELVLRLRDLPTNLGRTSPPKGGLRVNNWTGDPDWGGGPPASDAVASYDYLRYWKDARTPMVAP